MSKFGWVIAAIIGIIFAVDLITRPEMPDMNEYIKIGGEEYILLSSKVDTIWKTKIDSIKEYVPVPGPVEIQYETVPADVDTAAILEDYFAKVSYTDTIQLDSIGYIRVKDTISQNRIHSRSIFYNYSVPTITETTIVQEKPRNEFYLGAGMMLNSSLYGGVMWNNKGKRIYGIQLGIADTPSGIKPAVGGSIYFPLKFKK